MNPLLWLFPPAASKAEIRAEIWRLGSRHLGEPLKGAKEELKAPGLTRARAELLRAVVDQLRAA